MGKYRFFPAPTFHHSQHYICALHSPNITLIYILKFVSVNSAIKLAYMYLIKEHRFQHRDI